MFKLLLDLDSGERLDKGSWHTLDEAIGQGRLWLETISDFTRFSVCRERNGGPRIYVEARPQPFTPPRRSRPSALSSWPARLAA
jgi:hypothetical protein